MLYIYIYIYIYIWIHQNDVKIYYSQEMSLLNLAPNKRQSNVKVSKKYATAEHILNLCAIDIRVKLTSSMFEVSLKSLRLSAFLLLYIFTLHGIV
jgi:hypothetical protein